MALPRLVASKDQAKQLNTLALDYEKQLKALQQFRKRVAPLAKGHFLFGKSPNHDPLAYFQQQLDSLLELKASQIALNEPSRKHLDRHLAFLKQLNLLQAAVMQHKPKHKSANSELYHLGIDAWKKNVQAISHLLLLSDPVQELGLQALANTTKALETPSIENGLQLNHSVQALNNALSPNPAGRSSLLPYWLKTLLHTLTLIAGVALYAGGLFFCLTMAASGLGAMMSGFAMILGGAALFMLGIDNLSSGEQVRAANLRASLTGQASPANPESSINNLSPEKQNAIRESNEALTKVAASAYTLFAARSRIEDVAANTPRSTPRSAIS